MSQSPPAPPAYSLLPHLKKRFATVGRKLAYDASTPAAHRAWRGRARRTLRRLTGDADPLNGRDGVKNVKRQVSTTRRAYRTLDTTGHLRHVVFEGDHRWHGEQVPAFLEKHVGRAHHAEAVERTGGRVAGPPA